MFSQNLFKSNRAASSSRNIQPASSTSDWEDLDDRTSRRDQRAATPCRHGKVKQDSPDQRDVSRWLSSVGTPKPEDEIEIVATTEFKDFDQNEYRYYGSKKQSQPLTLAPKGHKMYEFNQNEDAQAVAGAENDATKNKSFFKGLFQRKAKVNYCVDSKFSDTGMKGLILTSQQETFQSTYRILIQPDMIFLSASLQSARTKHPTNGVFSNVSSLALSQR